MKNLRLGIILLLSSSVAVASTVGVSTHPFGMQQKRIFTTEFNSYFSNGSGMGLNAKYLHKLNRQVTLDAGFGISDGDRASRLTIGSDLELIPDYAKQPRVSLKGILETENIDGDRINTFGIAPTVSKGFSFNGTEAFPFLAMPVKVHLNQDTNKHETSTALATGVTGRLPIAGYENLVGNVEANFSFKNSYTALIMGISLPIQ